MAKARKPRKEEPNVNITPKTEAQHRYLETLKQNALTFCLGAAGSGKTYIATSYAIKLLLNREIDKIILTRPAVQAGESFGFLPGFLAEKYQPYLEPFIDIFHTHLGPSHTEALVRSGTITPKPLAFMRGITFNNAFVILDEAQNTTATQMQLFLTRIGEGCKIVVDGDLKQSDIRSESGLGYAVDRLEGAVEDVGVFRFGPEDCVRSKLVRQILEKL